MGKIICLIILALVSGCATGTQTAITPPDPDIAAEKILRVGVQANSPPMIFKQGGRMDGLEAELARGLASQMGKTVRFVELQWEELIPALLDKRIDIIMSGMSITQARKVRITFTEPYLRAGQIALVPGEDKSKYVNAYAIKLSNIRVGVEKGTTGDFLVQQEFKNAQIAPFDSPEGAAKALADGRINMFIHDAPVIWWLASVYESKGLTPAPAFLSREELAWGVRYDDAEMLKAANSFLSKWKNEGRLQSCIKRWIPYKW
jgi:polar amino acid transport system substrate-binding protein